jgi:hypothetical protein
MRLLVPLTIVAAIIVTTSEAHAKGPPDKVVITGPGIPDRLVVTDRALLQHLGLGDLMDVTRAAPAASTRARSHNHAYKVIDYLRDAGNLVAYDQLHYYPPTRAGAPGVVFYDGLLGANSSEFDRKWYVSSPVGDRAFQRLLLRPAPATRAPSSRDRSIWPALPLAILLVASGLVALRLRRRRAPADTTSTG